jgi:uncharacterized membrane protein
MIAGLLSFSLSKSKHRFFVHHIITILLFAAAYFLASKYINESMMNKSTLKKHTSNNNVSFWDCLYFSLVTQTTVGYGDIVPTHAVTKFINVLQLLTIYGVLLIEL